MFDTEYEKIIRDPKQFSLLYQAIEKLGMPNYYPEYMVVHGMGGNYDKKTLNENFNPRVSWKKVLAELAQLPKNDLSHRD